jgi:glycerate 2-kinase
MVSGCGSAILTLTYKGINDKETIEITLKNKQNVTNLLLSCGASIDEINCVSKHLSKIKGGRLAQAIYPTTSLNLILSDVIGDRLDVTSSGPTSWDNSNFKKMDSVFSTYEIKEQLPESVMNLLSLGLKGEIKDTPNESDKSFEKTTNCIIDSNYQSLVAAKKNKRISWGIMQKSSHLKLTGKQKKWQKCFTPSLRIINELIQLILIQYI